MESEQKKWSDQSMRHSDKKHRTLEDIFTEYKMLSLDLFKTSDVIAKDEDESNRLAKEQAQLLDRQQALLVEANAMKIASTSDALILLDLWKTDEIYEKEITPRQGIVLHVSDYLKAAAA